MTRLFTSIMLFVFGAGACNSYIGPDQAGASEKQRLLPDKKIIELLEAHDVPGMAYAELRNCTVVETGKAGYANVEAGLKTDGQTIFEAASLSKPVFAWLVMSLAEEGIVALDEPFSQSGFDYARISDKQRYAQLTPRLVLMHRTGLPNWAGDSGNPDRTDIVSFDYDPGTVHSYSGEGYLLLQSFVEQRTGQSLQSLFDDRLGKMMPHSAFRHPLPAGLTLSRGYFRGENANSEEVSSFSRENAAYSLVTTASDFARFMSSICQGKGLSVKSYRDMLRVQTDGMPGKENPKRWRLGWEALTIKGRAAVFHSGDNGNYMAMALFFPDNGEGYVVMTNADSGFVFINDFLRHAGAGERSD